MMENHAFCDSCPGCRPLILDMQTGKPVPTDDPKMVIVNRLWDGATTYEQRKAFIEFTLHNSRAPADLVLYGQVQNMIVDALRAAP